MSTAISAQLPPRNLAARGLAERTNRAAQAIAAVADMASGWNGPLPSRQQISDVLTGLHAAARELRAVMLEVCGRDEY